MKRKIFAACVLAAALPVMAGCADRTPDSPQKDTVQDSDTVSDAAPDAAPDEASDTTSAEAGKTVSPLPSGIDLDRMEDCTVAVSFEKGDAFVDDTGAMQLKAKVYSYDSFDMVDISMLQVGDQITICQENVEVTSLERNEDGTVVINGGTENGGYDLVTDDETVFFAEGLDGMKLYYELGEATIPVSADFEFEDSSDPEKGTCTYYPGDFLTDDAGIDYHFVPNNTTITIQGGYVIHMDRVYNP